MVLELNQPKTVALSQRFVFENVVIQKQQDNLSANIQFAIYNEKNERVGTQNYEYRNEQFNEFWLAFNSGKFLYEELIKKSLLPITLDDTIEMDFVYVKPKEPEKELSEDIIEDE